MSKPVLLEEEDGIATIKLNRPEQRNALSEDVSHGILEALEEIETSGEARCLVVTGSGQTFCAGGDVSSMSDSLEEDTNPHESVRSIRDQASQVIKDLHEFYLPSIAKINGIAFGAGANLALACDIQLASSDSLISFGFRQVGLGVDTGTSYLLPRAVGSNTAKELVFTGEIVEAGRAADIGLVNQVISENEFEERVGEFIEPIANGPTVGLRASKQALIRGFERDINDAMSLEATWQGIVLNSKDHIEGATAFMEDREADFQGK
jgi:enoyl-CoA hydratase/carnithine racemase